MPSERGEAGPPPPMRKIWLTYAAPPRRQSVPETTLAPALLQ